MNDLSHQILAIVSSNPGLKAREISDLLGVDLRSPENCRPRSLTSNYLLSGLVYCGECGFALQGCSAKSGRFHYYACHNSIRKGTKVCGAPMVNRDRIETEVVERLKEQVLTERNLSELLRLTNVAIRDQQSSRKALISDLDREIAKQQRKLDNLYAALETGKVEINDLAPRIRELRELIDQLQGQKMLSSQRTYRPVASLTRPHLKAYVHDLRSLLAEGSVFERKRFVGSFVKRITVHGGKVTIEYTYPTGGSQETSGGGGVLCSAQNGSPG